jgi:small subunit ribosomal protein S17
MKEVQRNERKTLKGIVVSSKMNKTVVVRVKRTYRHPMFGKVLTRYTKCYAHNDLDNVQEGDEVELVETRPLSKLKRWRTVSCKKSERQVAVDKGL